MALRYRRARVEPGCICATWLCIEAITYTLEVVRILSVFVVSMYALEVGAQVTVVLRQGGATAADVSIHEPESGVPGDPAANYDGTNDVDSFPGSRFCLMRWDLSSLPTTAVITSVSLTIDVTNPSPSGYSFYELLRSWKSTEATWLQAEAGQSWTVAGARGIGVDSSDVPLGHLVSTATGLLTIPFNSEGVAAVQRWVAQPDRNFGFIVRNLNASDRMVWSTSAAAEGLRPTLQIVYNAGSTVAFRQGSSPSTAYFGMMDTTIALGSERSRDTLLLKLSSVSPRARALLSFDVSSIPVDARVISAALVFSGVKASDAFFDVHPVTRPWTESATWATYDGTQAWASGGMKPVDDYEAMSFATFEPKSGPFRVPLSAAGVQRLGEWVRGVSPNHGFALVESSPFNTLAVIQDGEVSDPDSRPGLEVTYEVATEPLPPGPPPSEDGGVAPWVPPALTPASESPTPSRPSAGSPEAEGFAVGCSATQAAEGSLLVVFAGLWGLTRRRQARGRRPGRRGV